ncbi:helix-turn-helix domain-containing protein [Hymenobacter cellulosivorans]|uniref:Helix-turn-helix domain-containing protein n=1 Tax=Hymenobacter cellulosivorans TaxID=2932249 RepID=A0ABY4F8E4_9BACT|nr:AraC family transcriptional regulator [Hymenobacter cellulosivorans]UOQ52700.1 helix-turn-helix domain-containing protein [Hymenobacter cellulosivorans]
MLLTFTPLAALLFAVIAQAGFAAGLLWVGSANRQPNRFLALLMLTIALWLLDGFFRVAGVYGQRPEWYFLPIYYSFAFGPLLYFYVQSLINHDFRFQRGQLWHFGPVLVQAALYSWLSLQPYDFRNWFWQHVHRPYTYRLEFLGTWVSLILYLVLSLRLLRQYRRWLPEHFSEISQLRLQWLRGLLLALALVSGQWLVELVLREFFGLYYRYDFSTELLGIVVFIIGVVGLRQANMQAVQFTPEAPADEALELTARPVSNVGAEPDGAMRAPFPAHPEAPPPTPVAPREPVEVDAQVRERIRRALEDEQLFRNPTLTLAELSAHTGLPPRLISFTVNQGFGKSFNDLVNGLRVAEVQRRLSTTDDAARLTLLGIAFECGFNSKTTFNRIFKQFAGVSPSEYVAGRRP